MTDDGPKGSYDSDTIRTDAGPLVMTFIGHGTLMFRFNDKVIHIDPVTREGDYSKLPKADLVIITHQHGDHLEPPLIARLRKDDTTVILPEVCLEPTAEKVDRKHLVVMKNGDVKTVEGIKIEAVPAYNLRHMRRPGQPFHPKGQGNGYVMTFGKTRVYVAGDTENIPEMKKLGDIDVAFLPMNLPYTMTPEMVADAAKAFRPGILYPYHYGKTDPQELVKLLKDEKGIEVRVRKLQ
ncbi:MAG: MBL fold metallo-hydrolase [Planctomycetota bacterium]